MLEKSPSSSESLCNVSGGPFLFVSTLKFCFEGAQCRSLLTSRTNEIV
jgi:hypothetical protein